MPDELNHDRPLPWKAVKIGDVWDVTNDAGDPSEEFSVCEYMTEGEAKFIVRAVNAHADLFASCEAMLTLEPYLHPDILTGYGAAVLHSARAAIAKAKAGAA